MKRVEELYNKLIELKYGWCDKEGNLHYSLKGYSEGFKLRYPEKVLKDNCAVCWEICELQRDFFNENNIENKTIFAYLNKSRNNACHTFSVFYMNDKCYWFEASWDNQKGIHEFNNLEEVLEYYRNNFQDFSRCEYDKNDMLFFEYQKPEEGIEPVPFYAHCMNSKLIK